MSRTKRPATGPSLSSLLQGAYSPSVLCFDPTVHEPGNLVIGPSPVSRTSSATYLATAYAADP